MDHFTVSEAQLPALMVESVLYGIYLTTFFACLHRLLWNKNAPKRLANINLPMLAIVILSFISLTLNVSFALARDMDTFVYNRDEVLEGDDSDADWIKLLKTCLIFFQFILADSVLIYRCWLVWDKSLFVVIIPATCWIGALACSIYATYLQYKLKPGFEKIKEEHYLPLYTAFLLFTIILNLYSTGIILWRIWSVEKAWQPPSICSLRDIPQRSRLLLAKRVIIESGLLYTSSVVALFITTICQSNATLITAVVEIQIAGIAFNLILARAARPDREEALPLYYLENRCCSPDRTNTSRTRVMVDAAVMTTNDSERLCPDRP